MPIVPQWKTSDGRVHDSETAAIDWEDELVQGPYDIEDEEYESRWSIRGKKTRVDVLIENDVERAFLVNLIANANEGYYKNQ